MGVGSPPTDADSIYGAGGHPFTNRISAAMSASRTRPRTTFISSSQLSWTSGTNIPVIIPVAYEAKRNPTCHCAALNGIENCWAKYSDSGSFAKTVSHTDAGGPLFSSDNFSAPRSSLLSVRQEAYALIFSASRKATAARSFASATFLSDSDFSLRPSTMARRIQTTSTISPEPIQKSAKSFAATSQFVSSGLWKWIVAQNSKAIPAKITRVAIADQRSSDSRAALGLPFLIGAIFDERWLRKRVIQLITLWAIVVIFTAITAWLHWS